MAKMFAWSNLYQGGETKEIPIPNLKGVSRTVVISRNIIKTGEEVTKAKLKVSDEEWDHLVATGSIRPYPLPEGADSTTSPARAIMRKVVDDRGDIDPNILLELSLTQPVPLNPPAEEGKEVPAGV